MNNPDEYLRKMIRAREGTLDLRPLLREIIGHFDAGGGFAKAVYETYYHAQEGGSTRATMLANIMKLLAQEGVHGDGDTDMDEEQMEALAKQLLKDGQGDT